MKVKFCGITRAEDALLAAELGAWAVGFVFWEPSPRYVTPEAARVITAALPAGIVRVGVFLDAGPGVVADVAGTTGIDMIQVHGGAPPRDYTGAGLPIITAVSRAPGDPDPVPATTDGSVAVLVDGVRPGSGSLSDWTRAAELAARYPVILSGGLTPDNVAAAIGAVRPMGVDVASGVEASPGVKNAKLMRRFMANASKERVA